MRDQDLTLLREQVHALEQQVAALKRTLDSLEEPPPMMAAPPPVVPPVVTPEVPPEIPSEEPPALPPLYPAEPPAPPRSAADAEANVVGVWFNRIAVVLLMLAAIYGFAWASDRGLIGPVAKMAMGFGAGLVSLAVGDLTHRRGLRAWALGIIGLGLGLLYASDWAAFHLFRLFPYSVAFGLMLLFAAAAAVLSLRYDALPVAWLGSLGAYLTPFLLYTGARNPAGLLTFVAIVNFGILALARYRRWPSLNVLGFAFTWMIFAVSAFSLWAETAIHLTYATVFFLTWTAATLLYHLTHGVGAHWRELTLASAGGGLYLLFGLLLVDGRWQGAFALAIALFYAAVAAGVWMRQKADGATWQMLFALSAAALGVATALQFDGPWMGIAWSIEGAALVYIGLRNAMLPLRIEGLILLAIAALDYVALRTPLTAMPAYAITVVALGAGAWAYQRYPAGEPETSYLRAILGGAALLMMLLWTQDQVDAWSAARIAATCPARGACPDRLALRAAGSWLRSTLWALEGFCVLAGGMIARRRVLRLSGVGVLGAALVAVGVHDIWTLNGGWRVLGLFALGLLLLAASYLYFRFRDRLR